ncbi:MAG: hypothetical protein WA952_19975, partial [Lewinella sp.]
MIKLRGCFLLLLLAVASMLRGGSGDTIIQQIMYSGPDVGEVFLTWKPVNSDMDSLLRIHPGTKRVGTLLGTPMTRVDSGFLASIHLPAGEDVYYCFWITRGDDGRYRDYWDLASGATITVGAVDRIRVEGSPEVADGTQPDSGQAWGAWLLAALLIAYTLARIFTGGDRDDRTGRYADLLVGTGLGGIAIHLLARADIFDMPVANLFRRGSGKLLAAGMQDICLISGTVIIGYLALWLFPRRTGPWILGAFAILLVLFTGMAVLNVDAVDYLGSPFTYQWLYYSDFLLSSDAWSALGAQASTERLVTILSLLLSVPVLGFLFALIPRWLPLPAAHRVLPGTLVALLMAAVVSASLVDWSIPAGQRN